MNLWCLHGAVGMAADWNDLSGRMAALGHTVHALDLWSYLDHGECDFEEFARRICEEARGEDSPPALIGYSLGGRLALHALLKDSRVWGGAMIVSAHPGLQNEGERLLRLSNDREWADKALTAPWSEFLAEWESQGILQGVCMASLADRAQLEVRREAVARGFTAWSLGRQADLTPLLETVERPVIWLSGLRDQKFKNLADRVWPQMPDSYQLGPLAAGHRVPWEAPDDFADCVEHLIDLINR